MRNSPRDIVFVNDGQIMNQVSPQRRRGGATLAGLAAIVLWSTTVALARSLSEQLGPLTAAAGVYAVSSVAALFAVWRNGSLRRDIQHLPRKYLFGCGAFFVSYMIFLYLGLGLAKDRQQVLEVGLLNYLWPILTLLLSVAFLGKKAGWLLLPATLLALAGIVLVLMPRAAMVGQGGWWNSVGSAVANHPVPLLLGLAAAVTWALYSTLTRRWAAEQAAGGVNFFLIATGTLLLPLCWFVNEPRQWSLRSLAETLFLGSATYLAYWLWDVAMRRGNILFVAAASYMTPLLSTIVTCCYLMVFPAPQLWWGCLLLIMGSILSWYAVSRSG